MTQAGRRAAPIAAAFALYVLARAAVASAYPWQRAFDDFWYLPETQRWLAAGRLGTDSTFTRVPLWHLVLGLHLALFGRYALLVLQSWIVLAAIALYARWLGRDARQWIAWLPLAVFLLSPQILLYSRQGVNELFIGLLALAIMSIGEQSGARGALAMGALTALAACTKASASLLGVLAVGYALRGPGTRGRALARVALGFAVVALPLLVFAAFQRGSWLIDNTTAFNLSGLTLGEWRALPDAATRQRVGLERWWEIFSGAPLAYLADAARRAWVWLLRPSSLDFGMFYRDYPLFPIAVVDALAFALLCVLALFGTRRRDAFVWLLLAGLLFACAFPLFTPRSPKIVWMFPALLLSARGVATLRQPVVSAGATRRILLFDGVCVFCNGAVQWLGARDPGRRLQFASLQGETAAALRARHAEIPEADESIVYVEADAAGERVYLRSDAAIRAAAALDSPWRRLAWLRFVPGPLRDAGYRAFARVRYRLFGRLDACPLPDPREAERFLP